jgi:hypothetical protein
MGEGREEGGRKGVPVTENASVDFGRKMRKMRKWVFSLGAWGITLFWTFTATLPG